MTANRHKGFLALLAIALACGSCAAQSRENRRLTKQPGVSASSGTEQAEWQRALDSGISHYKSGEYQQAVRSLIRAFHIKSSDQATLLFLGFSYEASRQHSKAAVIYRYLATLDVTAAVQSELLARMTENQEQGWRAGIRDKLTGKAAPGPNAGNSVAVLYFRNLSSWGELDPVIKGLAEILINDLARIQSLKLKERRQVQILIEELETTPTRLYDDFPMTEIGNILAANFLVTGGIERVSDTRISVSAGVVDARTGHLIGSGSRVTAQLSDVLASEKKLTLDIIRNLNLNLSQTQRRIVQIPPTQSNLAFIAFGKALHFADQGKTRDSQEQLRKALSLDPDFKLARLYIGRASTKRLSDSELESILHRSN